MQGKKKICAIFATVILFLLVFIYVTRFDVREGLCAEAGTDIEYILNENNLHDYINVSRVFDKYLTIDSTRACLKNHFRNLQAPLCGIFYPHSVAVARYAALIRIKSPTN